MPQGRRRKPFSAKQKKDQLQAKKEHQREVERDEFGKPIRDRHRRKKQDEGAASSSSRGSSDITRLNRQPVKKDTAGYDPNRYKLHFIKEGDEEIKQRKEQARLPLEHMSERALEISLDDVYKPGSALDMPKRPPWDYSMSKDKLLAKEEAYFKGYMDRLLSEHTIETLSYCEVNLETWRQLWRVLEMADVVLLIADARNPALHFPPAFYDYVAKTLQKPLILILNKIDLVPPELVVAWKYHFKNRFPELHIVCFTSFPKEQRDERDPGSVLNARRRRNAFQAAGPRELLRVLEGIVKDKVDLQTWHEKVDQFAAGEEPRIPSEVVANADEEADFHRHEAYKNGILTLGCCGYPNVGKSSIINGLMGKKVVSVSKTPGHTKHFQTIFLTPTVKLCDCPGLIFPSLVSKPIQVLAGIYPIAQVREPYSSVGYLSRTLSLPKLLRLSHPSLECQQHERHLPQNQDMQWSALDICEAWAIKRGFLTAKAARPDVYRAANHLLRLALEGRLCLCLRPTGFTDTRDDWLEHAETKEVQILQELVRKSNRDESESEESDSNLDIEKETESETETETSATNGGNESDNERSESEEEHESVSNNPYALLGLHD